MNKREVVKVIRDLHTKALELDMQVDWETGKLREPIMRRMTPHQRDMYVSNLNRQQFFKEFHDSKDNDPSSPEQAYA